GQQPGPAGQQASPGETAPPQDVAVPPPPPLESKPDVATALAAPAPAAATTANAKAPAGPKPGIVPPVPAASQLPTTSTVAQQDQKVATKPTGPENVKGADNGVEAVKELQKKVQEMRVTNGAAGGSSFNANPRGYHQSGPRGGARGGRGGFRGYNAH